MKQHLVLTRRRLFAGLFLLLTVAHNALAGVRILPIFSGGIYGGGSSFESQKTGFKGTFKGEFIPVLKFTDKLSLLPIIKGSYSGSQTATKIIDEGALFQQEQEYESELKLLYRLNRSWKLSAAAGGLLSYLRETKDENWGNGLYDRKVIFTGTDIEKTFQSWKAPTIIRFGIEVSNTVFPNYSTLSSQQGLNIMGQKTLDINSANAFIKAESFLSQNIYAKCGLTLVRDDYIDQKVVSASGLFSSEKRADNLSFFNGRVDYFLPEKNLLPAMWKNDGLYVKTNLSLDINLKTRSSNQNYYDTQQLLFVPQYYNYQEIGLTPSFHFRFNPSKTTFSTGAAMARRTYSKRLPQNESGVYLDKKMFTQDTSVFAQITYPLLRNFMLTATAYYYRTTSNNDFEGFYKYHYKSANYLLGLSYEF